MTNHLPASSRLAQIWRRAHGRYDWRYDYGAAIIGGRLYQYGVEFK